MMLPIIYFVTAMSYATVRYNFLGGVAWEQFPLFILNKAISFSMILLLLHVLIRNIASEAWDMRLCSVLLRVKISLHVLISVVLLGMAYYPKLTANNALTFFGSISILGGIVAFVMIQERIKLHHLWLIGLLMIHLAFLGFPGWLTPDSWHGFLPPISLLSFMLLCVIFVLGALHPGKLYFSNRG